MTPSVTSLRSVWTKLFLWRCEFYTWITRNINFTSTQTHSYPVALAGECEICCPPAELWQPHSQWRWRYDHRTVLWWSYLHLQHLQPEQQRHQPDQRPDSPDSLLQVCTLFLSLPKKNLIYKMLHLVDPDCLLQEWIWWWPAVTVVKQSQWRGQELQSCSFRSQCGGAGGHRPPPQGLCCGRWGSLLLASNKLSICYWLQKKHSPKPYSHHLWR